MQPTKYDPTTAPYDDEGLFYDGEEILSVIQYECDEECDYEGGYISILVAYYQPNKDQYNDANYYGYKSVAEYIEDEFHTDNLWRIAERGYDEYNFDELTVMVRECEGIELLKQMEIVEEAINERA